MRNLIISTLVVIVTAHTVPPGDLGLNYSLALSFRHMKCTGSTRARPGSESKLCKRSTSLQLFPQRAAVWMQWLRTKPTASEQCLPFTTASFSMSPYWWALYTSNFFLPKRTSPTPLCLFRDHQLSRAFQPSSHYSERFRALLEPSVAPCLPPSSFSGMSF